jgi:hypothetical protein
MKHCLFRIFCCAFLVCTSALAADGEWRIWKSATGSEIDAKLVTKGPSEVTLEKRDGKQLVVKLVQLSAQDQAFLAAAGPAVANTPVAPGNASVADLPATPGATSAPIPCLADPKWSYLLYLPKAFDRTKYWPVCFIMAPSGGDPRNMTRYILAADELGIILALSNESKSRFDESDQAVAAMVTDVYARLPIAKNLSIATGMSSGGRMAYLLAEREKSIAGILACGSGMSVYVSEGEFRDAKLRPNTVVCSLIGASDYNRREVAAAHKKFNKNSRLIWFSASQAWAEDPLIFEGLAHIYGKILIETREPGAEAMRSDFSKTIFTWAKQQQSTAPFQAYQWMEFLANFPGDAAVRTEAKTIGVDLAKQEVVIQGLKAEEAVTDFTEKYHSGGYSKEDKVADPARQKDAEKRAAEFENLPQADILKRLGEVVTGG